ncbi:MAG: threonine synthase [Gammaproteobacteria bacterium]|nr:threonine synthase [Gammaproteobacteria bacterium]MCZ6852487.1 threonine synthase [Gammaproteobacteria bacterium]
MQYVSTRGETPSMGFQDAVLTGLAPDGGLLVPESIPNVTAELTAWEGLSFVEVARAVVPLYVEDIALADLEQLITDAYVNFSHPEIAPLIQVGDVTVMELFHGPTLAFKDVALQLLGQIFEYILARNNKHLNILTATSGDTGSAAIAGVRGLPNVDIFVMYPRGRVSRLQELQMTTEVNGNVHCLAVDGSFDDCQNLLKTIFGDLTFKAKHSLGAANSVNWARVLAQIVYYGYASLKLGRDQPVSFCVPTGNFGNVFAGFIAKRMGFPIKQLILATNENDILAQFFDSGVYQRGEVRYTVTPAMDIQVASNFERFLYFHMGCDPVALSEFMADFALNGRAELATPLHAEDFLATAVDVDDTLSAIRKVYETSGYIADPHTAVGLAAAERFKLDGPLVCLATAHPAKFPEAVNEAVGADVAHHPALEGLCDRESRTTNVPADVDAIKDVIRSLGR